MKTTTNYILTLDFIKKHCEEVQGEWNGDESNSAEHRALIATDILEKINEIEEMLPEIL